MITYGSADTSPLLHRRQSSAEIFASLDTHPLTPVPEGLEPVTEQPAAHDDAYEKESALEGVERESCTSEPSCWTDGEDTEWVARFKCDPCV